MSNEHWEPAVPVRPSPGVGPGGHIPAASSAEGSRFELTKREVLQRYAFYRDAPESLRSEMEHAARRVVLEPETYFFDRGHTCTHVALVGAGSVRVFVTGVTRREITLYRVHPGETCPVNLLAVLLGMSAPAAGRIEAPLTAVTLPAGAFRQWVAREPIIRTFVFEALAIRLVDLMTLMEEICFRKMDQRLADFLLRGFAGCASNPPTLHVTHEQVAVELGSVREVISRLLRELEGLGAVELARSRIALRDPAPLRELVGQS